MFNIFKPSLDSIVDDILTKTYGIDYYGQFLPIDPILVAVKNGITVVAQNKIFGKYNPHTATIHYSHSHKQIVNRFCLAHLLGHHFLHPTKEIPVETDESVFRAGNKDALESEANQFALALLMPKDLVGTLIEIKRVNDVNILAHNWFGVSTSAMKYRLKQLKYLRE